MQASTLPISHNAPNSFNDSGNKNVLDQISILSGELGLELVSVSGGIDDVIKKYHEHMNSFNELALVAQEVAQTNSQIASSALEAREKVNNSARDTDRRISHTINALQNWATSAENSSQRIQTLSRTLVQIEEIAKSIEAIASNIKMLSLNATIEASRAGEAGRGFAVVAGEVKALSVQTREASLNIQSTLKSFTHEIAILKKSSEEDLSQARSMCGDMDDQSASLGKLKENFETIAQTIDLVAQNSSQSESNSRGLNVRIGEILKDVSRLDKILETGGKTLEEVAAKGEKIMQITAQSGAATSDFEHIAMAKIGAQKIAEVFENAIANGKLPNSKVFDTVYKPIANSNPIQYLTDYIDFSDLNFTPVQEEILRKDSKIVFCAAVDKNGFLPTHNVKFSQKQKPNDPDWNRANCRNRTIFNDRVGKKAGANTNGALVQAYRRDMGGGQFAMMKDISYPIFVGGKHWGGFRIGVRV